MFRNFFNRFKNLFTTKKKTEVNKFNLIFQPNSLVLQDDILFVSNKDGKDFCTVQFNLSENEFKTLKTLTRYWESDELEIIKKGIWFINLMQQVELENKKMAVISYDNNKFIYKVQSINIV